MKAKKSGKKAKGYYYSPDKWMEYFISKFRGARKKHHKYPFKLKENEN